MDRYEPNMLFRPGPQPGLNACVGNNGGPYSFWDYALGYFFGAEWIIDRLRNDSARVDLAVYPAAQNLRHAVELAIKHIRLGTEKLNGGQGSFNPNHNLLENWQPCREALCQFYANGGEVIRVEVIHDIIMDVARIDASGMTFRYPQDRSGRMHLEDTTLINVAILGEGLTVLRNAFADWQADVYDAISRQSNSISSS